VNALLLTLALVAQTSAEADTDATKRSLLTFSKNNYFITGFDKHNQAKFQIAFKYELWSSDETIGGPHAVYLAFSERALWRLYEHSFPFQETDYNPELFYSHLHHPGVAPPDGCHIFRERAGVEHESNGLAAPGSRSLNRTYVEGQLVCYSPSSGFISTTLKLWGYPWGIGENNREPLYAGPGELSVMAGADDRSRWYGYGDITVLYRKGFRDWRSGVQIDARWHPSRSSFFHHFWPINAYFYAQFFSGYRETLRKFDVNDTTFRVGIGLANRERRFEQ
jgi:phospholipase A1